jgi:hypothetical protein
MPTPDAAVPDRETAWKAVSRAIALEAADEQDHEVLAAELARVRQMFAYDARNAARGNASDWFGDGMESWDGEHARRAVLCFLRRAVIAARHDYGHPGDAPPPSGCRDCAAATDLRRRLIVRVREALADPLMLAGWQDAPPPDPAAFVRKCRVCGQPTPTPRSAHCGPTCRKRAQRAGMPRVTEARRTRVTPGRVNGSPRP